MPVITKDVVSVLINTGDSTRVDQPVAPRFRAGRPCCGSQSQPRTSHPSAALPRGKPGVIERDHGVFVFPDTSAPKPQHVYSVRSTARGVIFATTCRTHMTKEFHYHQIISTSTRNWQSRIC
jgi:nitrile hydratase